MNAFSDSDSGGESQQKPWQQKQTKGRGNKTAHLIYKFSTKSTDEDSKSESIPPTQHSNKGT